MSNKIAQHFEMFNTYMEEIAAYNTPAETLVWMYILKRTDQTTGAAKISQERIATHTGLSLRHVKRIYANLRKKHLLLVIYKGKQNQEAATIAPIIPAPYNIAHPRVKEWLRRKQAARQARQTGDKTGIELVTKQV